MTNHKISRNLYDTNTKFLSRQMEHLCFIMIDKIRKEHPVFFKMIDENKVNPKKYLVYINFAIEFYSGEAIPHERMGVKLIKKKTLIHVKGLSDYNYTPICNLRYLLLIEEDPSIEVWDHMTAYTMHTYTDRNKSEFQPNVQYLMKKCKYSKSEYDRSSHKGKIVLKRGCNYEESCYCQLGIGAKQFKM